MDTIDEIGATAGDIWRWLRDRGKVSVSAVEKGVNAPRRQIHMAIGWLAREGKIELAEENRGLHLWLTSA